MRFEVQSQDSLPNNWSANRSVVDWTKGLCIRCAAVLHSWAWRTVPHGIASCFCKKTRVCHVSTLCCSMWLSWEVRLGGNRGRRGSSGEQHVVELVEGGGNALCAVCAGGMGCRRDVPRMCAAPHHRMQAACNMHQPTLGLRDRVPSPAPDGICWLTTMTKWNQVPIHPLT